MPQGQGCDQVNDPSYPTPTYEDFGVVHNEWFGRGDWGNAIFHPWDSAEARWNSPASVDTVLT